MTLSSLGTIHDLMGSPAFQEALAEFIREELADRIGYLRAAVRDNTLPRAGQIEGEMSLLESLPPLLDKYARKYSPNRP